MRAAPVRDPARDVRRTATGILCALFLVFLSTFVPETPSFWVLMIRAMAEAGMIGGLADWFAVEALFRRPLGLPIPHTALLPANQKRAAGNIARFIDEYFMDPDQLAREIRKFDPVTQGGRWLVRRRNADLAARELSWAIRALIHAQSEQGVPDTLRDFLAEALGRAAGNGQLPERLADVVGDTLNAGFLDEVLLHVRVAIDENRPAITRMVEERSRWWITAGIDRRLAGLLIDGVLSVLDELRNPQSQRRAAFADSVKLVIDRIRQNGDVARLINKSLADYTSSDAFARTLDDVLAASLREIDNQLGRDEEKVQRNVATALRRIGHAMCHDTEIHATISARLEEALVPLLGTMRGAVRDYVDQTIAHWDSADLVDRIETEVGRDLQFIRINGAVLGAFLGGCFFLAGHFLG